MSAEVDQRDEGAPERLTTVVDLIEFAGRLTPSTAVVPGGHRVEDLRLVESARDHGIVDRIVLVGDKDRILAGVSEVGIEILPEDIVAAADDEQAAAATVELIEAGIADIVLKGDISTPIINHHMLPLAVRSTVSLATVFDAAPIAGGRPMVITDPGVTTVCNFGRMRDLVRNAVDVAHVVGIDRPRVAILSANEKQIPSLPSTRIGLQLAQRNWTDAVVCGPLSFDLATDPDSVGIKGLPDLPGAEEVAGRADVLVCPGIDAANVLYKTIAAMNKYGQASLASVTVGFPVPYIILSRSDSLETRLVSIALCTVYARHGPSDRAAGPQAASPPTGRTSRLLAIATGACSMRVAVCNENACLHVRDFGAGFTDDGSTPEFAGEVQRLADLACGVLDEWECGSIDAIVTSGVPPSSVAEEASASGMHVIAERQDERVVLNEPLVSDSANAVSGDVTKSYGVVIAAILAERLGTSAFGTSGHSAEPFVAGGDGAARDAVARCDSAHARSICEAARRATEAIGSPADDVNLVVAHVGVATTVAVVRGGQIVHINSVTVEQDFLLDGGRLGDPAQRQVAAMLDRVAREIGGAFVAAGCEVDAIVLTSQLIGGKRVCSYLRRRISRLAPVMILDESLDLVAMAAEASELLRRR